MDFDGRDGEHLDVEVGTIVGDFIVKVTGFRRVAGAAGNLDQLGIGDDAGRTTSIPLLFSKVGDVGGLFIRADALEDGSGTRRFLDIGA